MFSRRAGLAEASIAQRGYAPPGTESEAELGAVVRPLARGAERVEQRYGDQRARHAVEHDGEVGGVAAGDRDALRGGADHDTGHDRAGDRRQEGADDAAPEAVRQPDREVPEGETHDDPGEQAHQRGLPLRRPRDFEALRWR